MNKRLTITSGSAAYLINSILPGVISLGVLFSGSNVVYMYLAFLSSNLLTAYLYRNKGVAARFNAAQSILITILAATILLLEYSLFSISSRVLSDALEMAFTLQARDFISWLFTIAVFIVLLLFFAANIICWRHTGTRVFLLPLIGRWAWQSAILDDTGGEYAPLEEVAGKGDS